MTEELKQKGIKYACEYPTSYGKGYKRVDIRKAYIAGYEEATKELSNCLNCEFWKDKKYNVCREIKKLGKTCCTFWKLKGLAK